MQQNDMRRAAEERAGELPNDRRSQVRPKPPVDFEGDEVAPRAVEAERLRRVVRALGLDDSVPEDNAQLRDALFAVLGIIARRVEGMSAEQKRLRADVEEWACSACNTVYPGPPQPGFACVICPKCGGTTAPRVTIERMNLQARLERAERALVRAGFVDHGAQEWEPPLGKMPVARLVATSAENVDFYLAEVLDQARVCDGMLVFDGAFHGVPAALEALRTVRSQAPQGDTRQGVPAGWSMKEFGNGAFSISRIGGQSATFMPFGTPEEVIKHAFVTALLATSAAHTCTPADEWAEFETWHAKKYPCDPLTGPSAALRWSGFQAARAAQGAGTAPVDAKRLKDAENALATVNEVLSKALGFEPGVTLRELLWSVEVKLQKATHPAPVSTAPSKSPEFEGIGDAPVSTAAATTASASDVPCYGASRPSEMCPCRDCEAWRERVAKTMGRAADGQQGIEEEIVSVSKNWQNRGGLPTYDPRRPVPNTNYPAVPADGQQGAAVESATDQAKAAHVARRDRKDGQQGTSRAALDELIAALRPSTPAVYAPVQGAAYRHGYKDAVRAATTLARAPLPAQGAAQVDQDDSNTRTTDVDVARRWKSNGSFVTPDPEAPNA